MNERITITFDIGSDETAEKAAILRRMADRMEVAGLFPAPVDSSGACIGTTQVEARLNLEATKDYLVGLPLAEALWWFIENVNEDEPHRSELFFHLRELFHTHDPKAEYKHAMALAKR